MFGSCSGLFKDNSLPICTFFYCQFNPLVRERKSSVFWYRIGEGQLCKPLVATVIGKWKFKRDLGKSNSLHINLLQIYPIKERKDRSRLALIICNTEFDHLPPRNGADLDILGMKQLLEGLGYTVEVEEKLTARVRIPHPPWHTHTQHISSY